MEEVAKLEEERGNVAYCRRDSLCNAVNDHTGFGAGNAIMTSSFSNIEFPDRLFRRIIIHRKDWQSASSGVKRK